MEDYIYLVGAVVVLVVIWKLLKGVVKTVITFIVLAAIAYFCFKYINFGGA